MKIFKISLLLVLGLVPVVSAQAPVIVSVTPAQNELGIANDAAISVTFDIDMNASTINATSFIVSSRSMGRHAGTIAYDGGTRTATYTPDYSFSGGDIVTAVLTTAVQSSGGVPLAGSFAWSFTIGVPTGIDILIPQVTYSVGQAPVSIYLADFNGDKHLDIATANQDMANISILMNSGDSTFAPAVNYPVGDRPGALVAADFDADGDIDIAATSLRFNNVSVIKNNGSGVFGSQQGYPVGEYPISIAAADFDGDGDMDLATADMMANEVSVLLNNGDGSFGDRLDYHIGDNQLDGVLKSNWESKLANLKTRNKNLYDFLTLYPVGQGPHSIAAGDLNKDGLIDLATANITQNTVSILLNSGGAVFQSGPTYAAEDYPSSVFFEDFNGDRNLDLAVANMGVNSVSIFLGDSNGNLTLSNNYLVGEFPVFVTGADMDGDADIDLATANTWSNNATVLYNDGTGNFPTSWNYDVGGVPFSIFLGDYTGTGAVSLAAANSSTNDISVLMNVKGCDFYVPGDFNGSGSFNIVDIIAMHSKLARGYPDPDFFCDCAGRVWGVTGDVNNSCSFNISDVIDGFSFLHTGQPPITPCGECLPRHP